MSLHEPISIHEPVVAAPVKRRRRRLGVSWPTIILFAVVISDVNGFSVTTLQGAVGSLERSEPPFQRWLRDSSIMVVLYTAAVLVAVLLARRWFGRNPAPDPRRRRGRCCLAACTFVGIAEVANSAAYDYHLQTQHIELVEGFNHAHTESAAQPAGTASNCVGRRQAIDPRMHIRAVTKASALILVTTMLLVVWLLAIAGDSLWRRPRPDHTNGQQP